ncbi:MAG: aminopeptidase P family protein [Solirubrobacterales bacterium]|nr:aminopeptidase P family protein [Solirubrobacterales bacterium]
MEIVNVLICGDTETSAALRHEVPLSIGDPFLYLEADGRRVVVTSALEEARIAEAAPDLERLLIDALGRDELIAAGWPMLEIELEVWTRAAERLGIQAAVVPPEFPVALADRLRARGIELTPDEGPFTDRRRRKTDTEMAGIRRAADAAMAAMEEVAQTLRAADIRGDVLWRDGERLTSESVRARIREVCNRAGAPAPADIMVKAMGPDPHIGHSPGSGPLPAHAPVLIDLWPRDEVSDCWADMTRTFVRGEISDAIAELHRLVLTAHERSCAAVRPGIPGVELYGIACDVFEAAGHPTGRTKRADETLREGFYHGLGHGVGLQVHEAPALSRTGNEPLIAGDVIAVEPGTVVRAVGGVRVEDLLVVTDQGFESLTGTFPHDLAP